MSILDKLFGDGGSGKTNSGHKSSSTGRRTIGGYNHKEQGKHTGVRSDKSNYGGCGYVVKSNGKVKEYSKSNKSK